MSTSVKVAALIPAAGSGQRLGQGPKAFVEVSGKTLLERAITNFAEHVDEIVVAVPTELQTKAKNLLPDDVIITTGGTTRQETVYRLLQTCTAELVLIHDAARPFLAADIIKRTKAAVLARGAASVVMPVADSLIEATTGQTHDRSKLRAVQTPQGFRQNLILRAHDVANARGAQVTDDASLVRALGEPVALVEGSSWLLKVTDPSQLELARALAPHWDAQQDQATLTSQLKPSSML
ncbi:MAG: 2-C-methyl-D-erythritol 4-phosphate cytidylyltransferase [Deinococcota bacterium]